MGLMIMPAAEAGFEIQGSWGFQFNSERTTDDARNGSYCLRTRNTLGGGIGGWGLWQGPSVVTVGKVIVFGAWIKLESGSGSTLQISSGVDPDQEASIDIESDGSIIYRDSGGAILRTELAPDPGTWFRVLSSWVVSNPGLPFLFIFHETGAETRWLVDDVTFQDGNMITKEIFDDAVLDLQAVNGTGIFTTAFDAVYSEPTTQGVRLNKTAEITPLAGGDDDSLSVGDRARGGIQRYGIKVQIRSGTPRADIQTAIDDVRNALQRSTSNIKSAKTAGTVEDVSIEWDEPMTSEDISVRVAEAALTLTVKYTFTAGAA